MNESNFAGLKYFPDQRLNIRQIENIDTKSILRGNVKELLGVMNDLAYIDVENDEYIGGTQEAKKLYKLCQYGLQYMMYTVTKLGDNTLLLRDYLQIQDDKKKKLQELINSQEETLKNLRQKKKSLQETEKNYQTLLRTLNVENSTGDPREIRRFASFDSDTDRREDAVPLNLPKGPNKRNQSRERSPGVNNSNTQTRGTQDNNYDERDRVGYSQGPRGYLNESGQPPLQQYSPQYGTSQPINYQPAVTKDAREQPRHDERQHVHHGYQEPNVPPRTHNETPPRDFNDYKPAQDQDIPARRPDTSYGYQPSNKGPQEEQVSKKEENKYNQYGAAVSKDVPKKGKDDDYEDDYEEDFELSESYVPDNSKIPSRFGRNQQARVRENVQASDKKRDDPEDTISMDFDKEFNKNYLDNLDRLVTKNKPGVEVPVKKFY